MPAQEERLTTLEKTVALLQKSSSTGIEGLNRNVTMLLGIVSSQQLDIKEIKISQITVEERLESGFEGVEKRLGVLEGRFEVLESRFEAQDKKLDQILLLLNTHTPKPDQET